ncbi:hypothetical protein evm_008936 [Chilo suppressalis]|nr:hypothetical protein evm_008936 [Chilo suppressalis]
MAASNNPFNKYVKTIDIDGKSYKYFDLAAHGDKFGECFSLFNLNNIFPYNHHQPINVPTAGAQAFSRDGIGRLGHDPPRGHSADWRVLTTADAAGTNG